MKFNKTELLKALGESFKAYKEHGARSPKKLLAIHNYVAICMRDIWGDNAVIHCMGVDDKEMTVKGKYYPKDIDITITDNSRKPLFCVGIKFVSSNYKQNANNYFETMMGETANIQANNGLPYAHLIFLRHHTPYYAKNETEIPKKIETINNKDISKYINLMFDLPQAHRPHVLGLFLVNIDEKTSQITETEITKYFDEKIVSILESKLSVENFFREIDEYSTYKSIEK